MVGELPDARAAGRLGFAADGDAVALLRASRWAPALPGSELAKLRGEELPGTLPAADLGELHALHAAVRGGVRSGALHSAHDIAEGGLLVALAECCIASGRGAAVDLDEDEALLFGEAPGAFVVSGTPEALRAFGSAVQIIGTVGGDALTIGETSISVSDLTERHGHGLADLLH
jgi:phosphoribosylformylglycinamidine synthase